MAASLSEKSTPDNQLIEQANREKKAKFVGIVTTKDANSLTLSDEDSTVFVTISGEITALAADINGSIKKADFLTLSSLNGLVMKADGGETNIIGTALEDFSSSDAKTQLITDESGHRRNVNINALRIEVTPINDVSEQAATSQKPFLALFGQSITGKPVSQWQVISALLIFFVVLVVVGAVIYGAIHSTIEALGRNPLAHKVVYRQLLQVLIVVFIILVFGGIAVYAVLWS